MSDNATPVDYYIFGTLKEAVSSGIGLQVFDGNGSPVFDSNYPAMRVVSVSTKAKGDISPHTQVAPSGSYAACFNGERAKTTADGQYFRYFGDKVLTSSSGAVSALALKSRMPSNFRTDDTWIHQQSQMLLVDVTGF